MNLLAPSILSADFSKLGEQIQQMDQAGVPYVHIDVMDGLFVPNISFGFPIINSIRPLTERVFDVHLMIIEPERYIERFAQAGADIITVHAEACQDLEATVDLILANGCQAAVAIKPATGIEVVKDLLPKLKMVLLMGVEPGFGGQKFKPEVKDKIIALKSMIDQSGLDVDIEVDGGIGFANVAEIAQAGANVIVAGSKVFKGDLKENVKTFMSILNKE